MNVAKIKEKQLMDINGNTNKSYKTLVLGDIHGRFIWKQIIEQEQPDRVIFIGDYFDSYDLSAAEQIHNFKEIIEYKESGKAEVILLIGNHDYHYMSGIDEHYSGYQHKSAPAINQLIEENKHHLQMVYQMDKYLFSHAGVSSEFMNNVFGLEDWQTENIATLLNEQFKYKPLTFAFGAAVLNPRLSYLELHGDNIEQSPIWIRPRSLMSANHNTLRKQIVQVVGHTQVNKIDVDGKADGNRYWFIDCLGTSSQYMIIDDKGEVSIKS